MTITAARPQTERASHVSNLDGARAIAIAAVVAYHATVPGSLAGRLGVDVFFPLSGYLITGLLLKEINRSGRIRLRRFYARRIFRLYPALLVTVVLTLAFRGQLFSTFSAWTTSVGLALSYATNLAIGFGRHSGNDPLSPTWSLALEEQFYLLWPLALLVLLRYLPNRRHVAGVVVLLAGASWIRLANLPVGRGYFRPDARVGGLLIGCAAGLLLHERVLGAAQAARLSRWALVLAVPAIALASRSSTEAMGNAAGIPLLSLATALTIPRLIQRGSPIRVLSHPAMVWLGQRSYGLYLVHLSVLYALRDFNQFGRAGRTAAVVGVSVAIAAAMHRFVEEPTLAWRDEHLAA